MRRKFSRNVPDKLRNVNLSMIASSSEMNSDCIVRLFLEILSLYTNFMTSMFDGGDEMKGVTKFN